MISFLKRKLLRNKEAKWNYEFAKGNWDGLGDLKELGRFSTVIGYLSFFKPQSHSILEFGCADGLLYQRMHKELVTYYEGIDASSDIIKVANQKYGSEKVKFVAHDMDEYKFSQKYDFIVFNEVLYYSRDYKKLLARCFDFLNPNGFIILSINGGYKNLLEYNSYLTETFEIVDKTIISNIHSYEITIMKQKSVS